MSSDLPDPLPGGRAADPTSTTATVPAGQDLDAPYLEERLRPIEGVDAASPPPSAGPSGIPGELHADVTSSTAATLGGDTGAEGAVDPSHVSFSQFGRLRLGTSPQHPEGQDGRSLPTDSSGSQRASLPAAKGSGEEPAHDSDRKGQRSATPTLPTPTIHIQAPSNSSSNVSPPTPSSATLSHTPLFTTKPLPDRRPYLQPGASSSRTAVERDDEMGASGTTSRLGRLLEPEDVPTEGGTDLEDETTKIPIRNRLGFVEERVHVKALPYLPKKPSSSQPQGTPQHAHGETSATSQQPLPTPTNQDPSIVQALSPQPPPPQSRRRRPSVEDLGGQRLACSCSPCLRLRSPNVSRPTVPPQHAAESTQPEQPGYYVPPSQVPTTEEQGTGTHRPPAVQSSGDDPQPSTTTPDAPKFLPPEVFGGGRSGSGDDPVTPTNEQSPQSESSTHAQPSAQPHTSAPAEDAPETETPGTTPRNTPAPTDQPATPPGYGPDVEHIPPSPPTQSPGPSGTGGPAGVGPTPHESPRTGSGGDSGHGSPGGSNGTLRRRHVLQRAVRWYRQRSHALLHPLDPTPPLTPDVSPTLPSSATMERSLPISAATEVSGPVSAPMSRSGPEPPARGQLPSQPTGNPPPQTHGGSEQSRPRVEPLDTSDLRGPIRKAMDSTSCKRFGSHPVDTMGGGRKKGRPGTAPSNLGVNGATSQVGGSSQAAQTTDQNVSGSSTTCHQPAPTTTETTIETTAQGTSSTQHTSTTETVAQQSTVTDSSTGQSTTQETAAQGEGSSRAPTAPPMTRAPRPAVSTESGVPKDLPPLPPGETRDSTTCPSSTGADQSTSGTLGPPLGLPLNPGTPTESRTAEQGGAGSDSPAGDPEQSTGQSGGQTSDREVRARDGHSDEPTTRDQSQRDDRIIPSAGPERQSQVPSAEEGLGPGGTPSLKPPRRPRPASLPPPPPTALDPYSGLPSRPASARDPEERSGHSRSQVPAVPDVTTSSDAPHSAPRPPAASRGNQGTFGGNDRDPSPRRAKSPTLKPSTPPTTSVSTLAIASVSGGSGSHTPANLPSTPSSVRPDVNTRISPSPAPAPSRSTDQQELQAGTDQGTTSGVEPGRQAADVTEVQSQIDMPPSTNADSSTFQGTDRGPMGEPLSPDEPGSQGTSSASTTAGHQSTSQSQETLASAEEEDVASYTGHSLSPLSESEVSVFDSPSAEPSEQGYAPALSTVSERTEPLATSLPSPGSAGDRPRPSPNVQDSPPRRRTSSGSGHSITRGSSPFMRPEGIRQFIGGSHTDRVGSSEHPWRRKESDRTVTQSEGQSQEHAEGGEQAAGDAASSVEASAQRFSAAAKGKGKVVVGKEGEEGEEGEEEKVGESSGGSGQSGECGEREGAINTPAEGEPTTGAEEVSRGASGAGVHGGSAQDQQAVKDAEEENSGPEGEEEPGKGSKAPLEETSAEASSSRPGSAARTPSPAGEEETEIDPASATPATAQPQPSTDATSSVSGSRRRSGVWSSLKRKLSKKGRR